MRNKNRSKNELVQTILDVYQPEIAKGVQDVFGPIFEAMIQGKM